MSNLGGVLLALCWARFRYRDRALVQHTALVESSSGWLMFSGVVIFRVHPCTNNYRRSSALSRCEHMHKMRARSPFIAKTAVRRRTLSASSGAPSSAVEILITCGPADVVTAVHITWPLTSSHHLPVNLRRHLPSDAAETAEEQMSCPRPAPLGPACPLRPDSDPSAPLRPRRVPTGSDWPLTAFPKRSSRGRRSHRNLSDQTQAGDR